MAAATQDSEDIISGINVTPLVDIILVVLIIFVVTASFVLRTQIPVELPRAQSAEAGSAGPLTIAVTREGEVYVNGRPASLDAIGPAVAERRAQLGVANPVSAFVSADTRAAYGAFATVVDRLRVEGVTDIALDTRPPEAGASAP